MIIILSQRDNEFSTEEIMQWIDFFKKDNLRINGEDILKFDYCYDEIINLEIDNDSPFNFKIKDVKSIFFRRYISLNGLLNYRSINMGYNTKHKFANHIYEELNKGYEFFLNFFNDVPQLSSLKDEKLLNKLVVLKEAKNVNFEVPEMLITSDLNKLRVFVENHIKVIVKPLSECQFYVENNYHYKMLSKQLIKEDLKFIPDTFFPSFFQKYIEKQFELRVFFLENTCYSMAIFSQENDNTAVDFRNYDDKKPNRTVPYKLPKSVENKIKKLMNKLNLKTGSIDLIKTLNNDYVFLEINVNGQFGMVSHPCNYYLEKEIVKYLIKT